MIDIHSHVLPGVDDGSESMEMSLDMLAMAADSGVRTLVATPHSNIPWEFDNYRSPELEELFLSLQREAEREEIPIRLIRGMEIYATPELPELLREQRVWTLNGGRYFLTEFSFREDPDFCSDVLHRCRALGYRPVIAHPERYYFLQDDPQLAYEWCTAGYPCSSTRAASSAVSARRSGRRRSCCCGTGWRPAWPATPTAPMSGPPT